MHIKKMYNAVLKKDLLRSRRFHVFLIMALCVIVYSNSFQVPFHFDDKFIIVKNPIVKDLKFFFNPSQAKSYNGHFEYGALKQRYVGMLTFALNYRLHQMDVAGYHWVNLLIHVLNALLVYLLVILTFRTPFLKLSALKEQASYMALFAGLFFACHPVQTQAVTYIWQRVTSLSTTFYCLSLIMYIQARLTAIESHSRFFHNFFWYYLMSVISAILGMKTKEIAFTLPVVIALYEFMFFDGRLTKRFLYLIPLLLTMLIIPLSLLGGEKGLGEMVTNADLLTKIQTSMSRWDYFFTQFVVIATYIRLIFLPVNQNIDYDYPIFRTFFNTDVLLSFILLSAVFGLGVYMFFYSRYRNKGSRLIAFGIFWFFLTHSVESSIIPIVDVINEHRVYLPSVGVSIALISGLFLLINRLKGGKISTAVITTCLLAVVILSAASFARNNVWKSELSLWRDCMEKSPKKDRPHLMLADALKNSGRPDEAVDHYLQALRINPYYTEAYNNLGNAMYVLGRYDEAVGYFLQASRISPDYADVYNNLGNALYKQGRIDAAIEQYKVALRLSPDHPQYWKHLSLALSKKGDRDECIQHYLEILRTIPDHEGAHYNVGIALAEKGEYDKAIEHFTAVLRLKPNNANAQNNLGNCLLSKGQIAEAIVHYRKALEIQPDHEFAYQNLMRALEKQKQARKSTPEVKKVINQRAKNPEIYYRKGNSFKNNGKLDEAIQQYQKALEIQPDFTPAINDLGLIYVAKGEYDKAFLSYQKIIELKPDNYIAYYNVACMYAKQNKIEEAIDWLKKAVKHGFRDWEFLKTDKDLENIRETSYFKELAASTKNKVFN